MDTRGKHALPEKSVRSKMQSAWNHVRYGKNIFELKTNFSESSPVWLLSKHYHRRKLGDEDDKSEIKAFEADFASRLWFTYRKEFAAFPGTTINSDCGWGCMLRTGQMMMAQGLIMHTLGRDWRRSNISDRQTSVTDKVHRDIIRLFADTPDYYASPISIHNLVRLGRNIGKQPGNWFGPASVAHMIQLAVANYQGSSSILSNLAVYVAQDCTVYKEDIIDMCTVSGDPVNDVTIHDFAVIDNPNHEDHTMHYSFSEEVTVDGETWCFEQETCRAPADPTWKSLIVFIPCRLGGEKFNDLYSSCLKSMLTLPSCLGWVGGRPTHSLYFLGFQDEQLIHLDPHRLQTVVDTSHPDFSTSSYHSSNARKISISRMDPSCCLGFYLRTRDEFETWCEGIAEFSTPPDRGGRRQYPIFTVCQGSGGNGGSRDDEKDDWTRMDRDETSLSETQLHSEEFVFL